MKTDYNNHTNLIIMKKLFILVLVSILSIVSMQAQDELDAFRFSQTDYAGTARFMGAGSSFGAIGGDFSSLAVNPAGIGVFKRHEISFTPVVISAINTESTYGETLSLDNRVRYSLTNFGMAFSWKIKKEDSKWKMAQFAFGYNRIYDFNRSIFFEGRSNNTSMTDDFVASANGTFYENLTHDAESAWQTWLIDTIPGSLYQYYSPLHNHDFQQNKYYRTTGGIDEMSFSFGGNYNDNLFVGVTIGVPFLDYTLNAEYEEIDDEDFINSFEKYTVTDRMHTTGVGINAKIGVIYQPIDFLRIGVAFHTPTFYNSMKETLNRQFYVLNQEDANSKWEYDNTSKYKLSTPLHVIGSLGFIIAKRAFINAEYEFVPYSMATLYSSDNNTYRYNFSQENTNIQEKYKASHSVRIGGEVTITNYLVARVGYGFTSSPYKESVSNGNIHNASCGIGYRGKYFFADFAYTWRLSGEDYYMYSTADLTSTQTKRHRFALSLGWKF